MDIFKLVGSVFVDTDEANKSISKTDKNAGGLGQTLVNGAKTAGKFALGLGTACAAGAAAMVGVATKSAEAMDVIDKGSQKIGISKQAYQEWGYVLGQNGMDVSKLETGMKTLVSTMDGAASGTESAQEKFDKLGLSIYDSNGNMKDQETMLNETMYALANMENGTEKARMATEMFGKAGIEMMPMLNGGAAGMEELTQRAHDLGLVVSDEAVTAGVTLGDTMDDAKQSLGAITNRIGIELMPIIQGVLDWILANMPTIQSVCETVFGVISTVVTTVGGVLQEIFTSIKTTVSDSGITFTDVMNVIKNVVSTAFTVIQTIWNTIGKPVFNLIKLIVGEVARYFSERMPAIQKAVSSAFTDIQKIWNEHLKPCFQAIGDFINNVLAPAFKFVFKKVIEPVVDAVFKGIGTLWNNSLKPIFTGIVDFIKNVFSGNFSKAFENIISIVKGIWNGIVDIIKIPINAVIGIINKFIGGLNKLKIPDWVPLVGGKGINISEIPLLAEGGTAIGAGKAIVGEAGAELIDLPAGARVTPLTNGKGDPLGNEKTVQVLYLILAELKALRSELYDTIVNALVNGVEIDWSDRELARLVRKYA